MSGDKLVRVSQQALCIYVLGALGHLALLERCQDVLAAHVKALLGRHCCLLKQVCCLGQEIRCQGLHCAAARSTPIASSDLGPQHPVLLLVLRSRRENAFLVWTDRKTHRCLFLQPCGTIMVCSLLLAVSRQRTSLKWPPCARGQV